jgi:hypothetical protein
MITCVNTNTACRLSVCEYCNPTTETIADFEAAIFEAQSWLETAKAKNAEELVAHLNHEIRKFRRAIKKLQAGA